MLGRPNRERKPEIHRVGPEFRKLAQQFDWKSLLEAARSWPACWANPGDSTAQVHRREGARQAWTKLGKRVPHQVAGLPGGQGDLGARVGAQVSEAPCRPSKSGQLQPFVAVLPQGCGGQLALFFWADLTPFLAAAATTSWRPL
jgi:hypothetical protein